jgi:hypothetical protein
MYGASAWEAQTKELIARIEHEIEEIQAETTKKMAILKKKKSALEESLLTYREMMYLADRPASRVLMAEDIRDKSQKEILSLIASRNSGLLIANQAVKLMREAGVFGNPDNASSAVYSVLKRAKEFERVGQGVYKLRDWADTAMIPPTKVKRTRTVSGVRQAVKELKEKYPEMTKEEVLNTLIKNGFDFKGKKPANAVNLAWAFIGYSGR